MKNGFIYTDAYLDYDYGLTHPLKIIRLKLAYELIQATGLLRLPSVQYIPTRKAEEEDLAFFHTRDYLSILKKASEGEFQASVASVRNSLVDFRFRNYLFLSTSDIYPDCSRVELTHEDCAIDVSKQSPYGFHKYLAELCVQHGAADWLIVRQGGFVGEGLKKNVVYDVLHGDRLWVHPDSEFQFINTDDSARLIMELINKGVSREIFNLTARGTISVHKIMQLAGREVPFDGNAGSVRYEIATEKAASYLQLPDTYSCIQCYLSQDSLQQLAHDKSTGVISEITSRMGNKNDK